jgi:hypothetical protein
LAISILDAFSKADITIPCGQTDITIRQMDWLREIVESASLPAGRASANGRKKSSGAPAADVSVLAK